MIDEFIQAYGCEIRKARLRHKCCECQGAIAIGEKYHYHHGIFDGAGVSFKRCVDCEKLANEINTLSGFFACFVPLEGLQEWVFENGAQRSMREFIEVKKRRGAMVEDWMIRRVEGEED